MEHAPRKRVKISLHVKPRDINGGYATAELVNIDPHGDVIFDTGKPGENILLRVSSEVIREASKVFAAMLGPKFLEGQGLQSDSSTPKPPVTIRLPEDGKTPFTILLSFLHGHTGFPMNTEQFAAVTSLIHKYAFADAAKSWTKLLLHRWALQSNPDWPKLLVSAYECDDATMFHRASREVMLRYDKAMILKFDDAVLPEGLLDALGVSSFHMCMDLNTDITISYNHYYSLQRASSLSHNDVQCTAVARIGAIATQMRGPGRGDLHWYGCCEDLRSLVLKLEQAEVASANSPCSCECCKFDMKGHLLTTITNFERAINTGICLICVKQGKYTIQRYAAADKRNCGLQNHREVQEDARVCGFCGHDKKEAKPKSHEGETTDGTSCLAAVFVPNRQSSS